MNPEHRTESDGPVRCSAWFGDNPPNDGREWDCQCARCGSSVEWEQCGECGGEGITAPGELYEQDPLWYDQDDYEPCHQCNGDASYGICLSSPKWCESHPRPGREKVERGTIEWYPLSPNTVLDRTAADLRVNLERADGGRVQFTAHFFHGKLVGQNFELSPKQFGRKLGDIFALWMRP